MDLTTNTLTPLGAAYLSQDPLSQDAGNSGAAASPSFAVGGPVRDRNLLWGPAEAGSGQASSSSSSTSRDSRQLSDSKAGGSWSERCEACIKHLGSGKPVEALPAEQRHMCSMGCGFWA